MAKKLKGRLTTTRSASARCSAIKFFACSFRNPPSTSNLFASALTTALENPLGDRAPLESASGAAPRHNSGRGCGGEPGNEGLRKIVMGESPSKGDGGGPPTLGKPGSKLGVRRCADWYGMDPSVRIFPSVPELTLICRRTERMSASPPMLICERTSQQQQRCGWDQKRKSLKPTMEIRNVDRLNTPRRPSESLRAE